MSAAKIELSPKEKTDTLALAFFCKKVDKKDKKKKGPPPAPEFFGKSTEEITGLLKHLEESRHFSGRRNETSLLRFYNFAGFPNVILLGMGFVPRLRTEVARQAGAALFLAQRRERLPSVTLDGESLFSQIEASKTESYLQAFCEGYLLAGYEFLELKQDKPPRFEPKVLQITRLESTTENVKAVKRAQSLAEAVNFARSLGDRPGNYATPDLIAKLCQKMSRETGLKCTVFNKARIIKEKMGLLMGVGKGSEEEPRFIIMEHKGGKANQAPVALIGKGISFDTGGISLKPPAKMEEMKYDMMGSATVAGIMMAVGKLKLPINVTGYIAAAENMPDGRAQKPGDIATSISGKTVEIINTDAEGRLALGDAVEYAQRSKPQPQAIIDYATLTGAVVVALGTTTTGIMGNNRGLIEKIQESSKATDEKVWELPLYEEFEDYMRSSVADIKNASDVREAGSSLGGTFIKFFVDRKMPWVHCDIAGSGMQRRDKNYMPRAYAAGVMVRLTTHMLAHWTPLEPVKEKD